MLNKFHLHQQKKSVIKLHGDGLSKSDKNKTYACSSFWRHVLQREEKPGYLRFDNLSIGYARKLNISLSIGYARRRNISLSIGYPRRINISLSIGYPKKINVPLSIPYARKLNIPLFIGYVRRCNISYLGVIRGVRNFIPVLKIHTP